MPPEAENPVESCWNAEDLNEEATLLAAITEPQDNPRAWLQTGEDLMRVLLKGASLGVNAAIMNLPPESEAVRAQVSETINCSDVPILLLRFGRPRRKLVTPRRSPVDVMLHPGFRH